MKLTQCLLHLLNDLEAWHKDIEDVYWEIQTAFVPECWPLSALLYISTLTVSRASSHLFIQTDLAQYILTQPSTHIDSSHWFSKAHLSTDIDSFPLTLTQLTTHIYTSQLILIHLNIHIVSPQNSYLLIVSFRLSNFHSHWLLIRHTVLTHFTTNTDSSRQFILTYEHSCWFIFVQYILTQHSS